MQGKLFFREVPEQDGKQWMVFGVVALPTGRFAAEHGYVGRIMPHAPLQVGIDPQQCTPPQSMMEEPEEFQDAEIHDVMKAVKWPRAAMDGSGRMILRGCPVTPPEGHECFILAACLALEARPDWRGEHLYSLQDGCLTDPQNKTVQALGSQPGQILQRPWWGFGPEPVGLTSTMALETLQQLDALDYLHDRPEAERREVLSGQKDIFGQPRFGFIFLNNDPDFNRFRQSMRANGVRTDWLKPRTFDDLDVRKRLAREVMDNLYSDTSDDDQAPVSAGPRPR